MTVRGLCPQSVLALSLLSSSAFAAQECPAGMHEAPGSPDCQRCLSDQDEGAGLVRYPDGEAAYEVAFVGARVTGMERRVESEPPVLQIADLRSGARKPAELCGMKLDLPSPSPAGLRWTDASGKVMLIEQRWGWRQRNMRNLYAMPDGTWNVVGARRYASPGAHMRGHWTDGYYHRRTLGKWRVTLENGSVESGQWAKGEPVGIWTVVATNGQVVERGSYARGLPVGKWTCRGEDGAVTTGRYRLGRRVGAWVTVNASGAVVSTVVHEEREEESPIRGRHWRGGLLSSIRVRSPCEPHPHAVLTMKPLAAVAPGVVVLRILDESGLPVPGVLVTLDEGAQSVVSDADGQASFAPSSPGVHQLVAQKPGFGEVKARFTVDAAAVTGTEAVVEMSYGGTVD